MQRSRTTYLIAGAYCGWLMCGCTEPEQPEAQVVRIAYVTKGASNTFFDLPRAAARLAETELQAGGASVEVAFLDPEEPTAEAQVGQVQKAQDDGYDAIALSVLDPAALTPAINEAVAAGVRVLTFDSDAPASERITYYGSDNRSGARQLARELAVAMGNRGTLAIMTTAKDSTSTVYAERLAGLTEGLADYPDLEVVATTYCANDIEKETKGCTALLEETMAAHPDISGWVLLRGRVLREADLSTEAPNWSKAVKAGTVHVVAFDAPEDSLPAIENGLAERVLSQKYFGWGYDVVRMTYDAVKTRRPFGDFTDSGFDVICPENVAEYAAMWETKDFRAELSACPKKEPAAP